MTYVFVMDNLEQVQTVIIFSDRVELITHFKFKLVFFQAPHF